MEVLIATNSNGSRPIMNGERWSREGPFWSLHSFPCSGPQTPQTEKIILFNKDTKEIMALVVPISSGEDNKEIKNLPSWPTATQKSTRGVVETLYNNLHVRVGAQAKRRRRRRIQSSPYHPRPSMLQPRQRQGKRRRRLLWRKRLSYDQGEHNYRYDARLEVVASIDKGGYGCRRDRGNSGCHNGRHPRSLSTWQRKGRWRLEWPYRPATYGIKRSYQLFSFLADKRNRNK